MFCILLTSISVIVENVFHKYYQKAVEHGLLVGSPNHDSQTITPYHHPRVGVQNPEAKIHAKVGYRTSGKVLYFSDTSDT